MRSTPKLVLGLLATLSTTACVSNTEYRVWATSVRVADIHYLEDGVIRPAYGVGLPWSHSLRAGGGSRYLDATVEDGCVTVEIVVNGSAKPATACGHGATARVEE